MGRKVIQRSYDNEGKLVSKECSCCHKVKPVSEFGKRERSKDGLQSQCKECINKRYQKKKKQTVRNYDDEGNLISKECTCCCEIKPVSKFSVNKRAKDGLCSKCKKCVKKYGENYYQRNKESKREYYQENKESRREYSKKYREENKESRREYDKKYYQENSDYLRENSKKYRQENKEKISKKIKKRRIKQTQEALQQINTEIETNPEKYNYNRDKKPYGIIYLVHNIKSNKYYVGQTTRAFDIRYPLGWLRKHGRKNDVKEDLELYGENSFEYIKIFDVAYSQYELDKLEAHYIDYYDSYENGYNGNRGNIFTNRGKET